ncbi:hypothetical protein [Aliiroseovarius sp. 2305UL8-7]|uniref:hypothetical protein n=1 Tax=Aliiroseovarius conchicola TaxID=3121637 RepID=UPI00352725BA
MFYSRASACNGKGSGLIRYGYRPGSSENATKPATLIVTRAGTKSVCCRPTAARSRNVSSFSLKLIRTTTYVPAIANHY